MGGGAVLWELSGALWDPLWELPGSLWDPFWELPGSLWDSPWGPFWWQRLFFLSYLVTLGSVLVAVLFG